MNWSVWGPPISVVVVGLLTGAVLAWRARGSRRPSSDARAELLARKTSLLEQLRTLDADAVKLDPEAWTTQREDLLQRAADVLREMDGVVDPPPQAERIAAFDAVRGGRWIWSTVIVGFFILLGVGLSTFSTPRPDGGTMTGAQIGVENDARQARIIAAQERLASDPDDVTALNVLAHEALASRDLEGAMQYMGRARSAAPDDPEVRTHLAILQVAVGMSPRADTELDAVLAVTPDMFEALFWKGVIRWQGEDNAGAEQWAEKASAAATDDEQRALARSLLARIRMPPPTIRVRGTVALAQDATVAKGAVLFVIVRRSAEGGGPPVAAIRLPGSRLPTAFAVTDGDMMMGGTWPEQVWVEARLDTDGNAMTKSDADMVTARVGPLASGAKDVALTLAGGEPPPPAAVVASAPRLAGTISLAEGAASPDGGMVFVMVRRAAEGGGPPVAALRLAPSSFPLTFSVRDTDMMLGGAWPEQVWVEARWDEDGNAMTRTDGDLPSARMGPLASGASGIGLELGG